MHIIFLGLPGSGKGVQTRKLQEHGFIHLSTGEVLRALVDSNTPFAAHVQNLMNEGKLIPDDTVNQVVFDFCSNHPDHSFLFDGYPRTIEQAKVLHDAPYPVSHVFYLHISAETARKRMITRNEEEGEREDTNTEEKIKERIDTFFAQTQHLVDYYQELGLLRRIDGEQSKDDVASQIASFL